MRLLAKYKWEILLGIALLIIYFVLRLTHILNLPLFTDEAIYIRWSQIAKQDASWRFISLTDGKQPMFVWIAMIMLRFIHDPLLAGRLVSVGAGVGSIIGLYFLGKEIFQNKWVGIISSALYVFYPFALVYDRMALYEPLVSMFAVWSLYLEILLIKKVRSDLAFITALVVGGSMLTKTSGFSGLYLLPLNLLIFPFRQHHSIKKFFQWIFYAGIVAIFANLYYSVLRLSPYFGIISQKDHTFYYPFSEWLQHPWTFFLGNLHGLDDWFITYMWWVMLVFLILGIFVYMKFWKEKIILLIWFGAPYLFLALFGKVLYPRYVFPMTMTLLPIIALAFYWIFIKTKKLWLAIIIFILALIPWLRTDWFIITDFAHAPIAKSDLGQYINDWPAGGGVKEIDAFIAQQSAHQKIFVATEGTFGSIATLGVEIYFANDPNVEKQGVWPPPSIFPKEFIEKAKVMPTYYVFDQTQTSLPADWPLKLIAKYQKGIGNSYMRLYQVVPK